MSRFKEISEILSGLEPDFKAEVLISSLIDNELISDDWIVSFDGLFKRRYKKDLNSVENIKTESSNLINFHVSRDGFYDALPEGLFHPINEKPTDNASELALESKRERKREEETRQFFIPFEQEIFRLRLSIENKEKEALLNLVHGKMNDLFIDFWKIDKNVDVDLAGKMIAFLPFVQNLVGNYKLVFNLLEHIIDEPVNYEFIRSRELNESNSNDDNKTDDNGLSLGNLNLGYDFLCGSSLLDLTPMILIKVGPIVNSKFDEFFYDGRLKIFIDCFCSFFLPLEVDYSLSVETNNTKEFLLPKDGEVIFGYDTYI